MGGFGFFLIIIAFVFLYFVLVRPQKKRQLQQQRLLDDLKVGDEIVTAGGLYGEIREVHDDEVPVRIAADLDRSISIMQNRINKLGVSEPEIRKQGKDQIVIQLAGVHDPAAAAALIGKTAQLMLFDFEADVTGPSKVGGNVVATPSLYEL